MYPRDMVFNFTGAMDYKNKALMSVQSSREESWHGKEIPPVDENECVRLEMKKGYNFF